MSLLRGSVFKTILVSALFGTPGIAAASQEDLQSLAADFNSYNQQLPVACSSTTVDPVREEMARTLVAAADRKIASISGRVQQIQGFLVAPVDTLDRARREAYQTKIMNAQESLASEQRTFRLMEDTGTQPSTLQKQVTRISQVRASVRDLKIQQSSGSPVFHPQVLQTVVARSQQSLNAFVQLSDQFLKLKSQARYCQWLASGKSGFDAITVSAFPDGTPNAQLQKLDDLKLAGLIKDQTDRQGQRNMAPDTDSINGGSGFGSTGSSAK